MTYSEYIQSVEWKRKRKWFLAFWNNRCSLCYEQGGLDVHHRTYERLGNELLSDCVVLCKSCHERHHKILASPKLYYFWQNTLAEIQNGKLQTNSR